jgi:hypothetical protein
MFCNVQGRIRRRIWPKVHASDFVCFPVGAIDPKNYFGSVGWSFGGVLAMGVGFFVEISPDIHYFG